MLPYPDEPINEVDVGGSQPGTSTVVSYDPVTYQPITSTVTLASGPAFTYKNKIGRWPGNNKQWWTARAAADDTAKGQKAGDFLPELLQTFYSGNNRAPRGHYIVDQFRKDRSGVSGVAGIPIEEINERPNAITFFSGRTWFGCQSTIYYSQILDGNDASKAGLCYQEADPTAEDISDLIASDGGVIPIPEANHIEALYPMANGVLVFAQNGVWVVSGGDQAFSALNIAVSKISPTGTRSPNTIVETDGMIFWWSEVGIQAVQQSGGTFGPIAGKDGNANIAESTIQTFYNNIDSTAKRSAKGLLDTRNNLIYWLYGEGINPYEYTRVLVYDITLQAFYPWKISTDLAGPKVVGLFLDSGYIDSSYTDAVTDNLVIVSDSGAPVTAATPRSSIKPSAVYYLANVPGQGLTVAAPVSNKYVDWFTFDNVGLPYDSYLLTGYELLEDTMRDKQVVYLFAHFTKTETADNENRSSCMFNARWDWADDRNTRKWSVTQEIYRPRTINDVAVVTSKSKVRGNGRSIQFRFGTSEPGRTFNILGWSVAFSGNTSP